MKFKEFQCNELQINGVNIACIFHTPEKSRHLANLPPTHCGINAIYVCHSGGDKISKNRRTEKTKFIIQASAAKITL